MICGWVTAIAIRTPFSGRLKVPFIIALITLLACSLYCYYCYTKDRRQIISEFKRQAEQKAEQEKELQTSPKYNVFIMVEDVHDERIDGSIFAKYKVERIKNTVVVQGALRERFRETDESGVKPSVGPG